MLVDMIFTEKKLFYKYSVQIKFCVNFHSTNNFLANIPFSQCVFLAFVLAMEFALGSCADPVQAVAKRRRRSGNHQTLMNADNDVLEKLGAAEDAKPGPATIREANDWPDWGYDEVIDSSNEGFEVHGFFGIGL